MADPTVTATVSVVNDYRESIHPGVKSVIGLMQECAVIGKPVDMLTAAKIDKIIRTGQAEATLFEKEAERDPNETMMKQFMLQRMFTGSIPDRR